MCDDPAMRFAGDLMAECDGCRREEYEEDLYEIDWDGIESYVCGLCFSQINKGLM